MILSFYNANNEHTRLSKAIVTCSPLLLRAHISHNRNVKQLSLYNR